MKKILFIFVVILYNSYAYSYNWNVISDSIRKVQRSTIRGNLSQDSLHWCDWQIDNYNKIRKINGLYKFVEDSVSSNDTLIILETISSYSIAEKTEYWLKSKPEDIFLYYIKSTSDDSSIYKKDTVVTYRDTLYRYNIEKTIKLCNDWNIFGIRKYEKEKKDNKNIIVCDNNFFIATQIIFLKDDKYKINCLFFENFE